MNPDPTVKTWMSNKAYDRWKWVAQIFLPAIATLYFALSQIWGLPKGAEVVGTITALDAFLGVSLGLATKAYTNSGAAFDGAIEVTNTEGKKTYTLALNTDPETLDQKKLVVFQVKPQG